MTNIVPVPSGETVDGQLIVDLPDNAWLTYIRSDEAWYAAANRITKPELSIVAEHRGGGCTWEFSVKEYNFDGKRAVRLEIFDDGFAAFAAFADIPWFFAFLRDTQPHTVDAVQAFLDDRGAEDRTDRVNPYHVEPEPTVSVELAIRTLGELGFKVRGPFPDRDF